jgi:F420-0:gamma-glutamyl ligase
MNSACGGYGAGSLRAQSMYRALKVHLDKFQERGITIIYISHYVSAKVRSPESEDYDVASIVMNHDRSREVFIDDVDAVLFCKLKTYFIETENGRTIAQSTGEHVIVTGSSDSNIAKNRFNMPNEIEQSFEAIAKYIPFYNQEIQE